MSYCLGIALRNFKICGKQIYAGQTVTLLKWYVNNQFYDDYGICLEPGDHKLFISSYVGKNNQNVKVCKCATHFFNLWITLNKKFNKGEYIYQYKQPES